MELDTRASASIMSKNLYRTIWPAVKCPPLQPLDAHLHVHTYSGELIQVLGSISVTLCYRQQTKCLSLLVTPTDGPVLFGRDWLNAITLDWKQLHYVHSIRHRALQDALDQYASLSKEGMGMLHGMAVKIHTQQEAHHRFFVLDQFPMHSKTKSIQNFSICVRPCYRASAVFQLGSTDCPHVEK